MDHITISNGDQDPTVLSVETDAERAEAAEMLREACIASAPIYRDSDGEGSDQIKTSLVLFARTGQDKTTMGFMARLENDFHGTVATVRVPSSGWISPRTMRRVRDELGACYLSGCTCEGISRVVRERDEEECYLETDLWGGAQRPSAKWARIEASE